MSSSSSDQEETELNCVMQRTRGFDKENPNHMRAARHLLYEVKLGASRAIVAMTSVLDMTPRGAFMYDTTRAEWSSSVTNISRETQDKLIDWLGKRPMLDEYHEKESRIIKEATEDLLHAKAICTEIQQIIPFLMSSPNKHDDPERLDLLQKKYLNVVAPATNGDGTDAFRMGEYLWFLDLFLYSHPCTRVLGKAVCQAWVYRTRAHQQDRSIKGASLGRLICFNRVQRGYSHLTGDNDYHDKVLLPEKYVRESISLLDAGGSKWSFDWNTMGKLDLSDLLKKAASQCATCQKTDCKLKRCSACNKIFYCSTDCQTIHWKQHKKLCKAWRTT